MQSRKSPDTIGYVSSFVLLSFSLGILLAFSIISLVKVTNESGCNNCVSDNCTLYECLSGDCHAAFRSPYCCFNLSECAECDPFGLNSNVKYFINNTYTNIISNSECVSDIYVQGSVITNNDLLVQCFDTFDDSRCTSQFGVVTINDTMLVDFIQANTNISINLNGFILNSSNIAYFNTSGGTIDIDSLSLNGTLYANALASCLNEAISVNGIVFYPNGTVVVSNANITAVNITNFNSVDILSSASVQGILFRAGSVQGFYNNEYSNLIIQPVGRNILVGYTDLNGETNVTYRLDVNGTLGTTDLLMYPNNCTNVTNCLMDYFYVWEFNTTSTGGGQSYLSIKVMRFGKDVYFRVKGVSASISGNPAIIYASLSNSSTPTGIPFSAFLSTSKIPTKLINVWVNSLNLAIYAIASIDTLGLLSISFDPYHSFSSTAYFFNDFTMQYTLFN